MTYAVKEIFYTLQGEGANAGRPAVFIRFAGCNLWSGREKDRASAVCRFCDTDFVGGTRYSADEIANEAVRLFPGQRSRMAVFTGGEPALQFDLPLLRAFRDRHFFTAIETNGTTKLKAEPDWITVSPKTDRITVTYGDELKLIYPQEAATPQHFGGFPFGRFYLQPKWERWPWRRSRNLRTCIAYCHEHPQWRLSTQMHKAVGIA